MSIHGVYEIKHIISGRRYIGSAVDVRRRFTQHRRALRKGVHHSQFMQRAWNKYGEAEFAFQILEVCAHTADVVPAEQRYIDTLKPEYNAAPTAGSMLGFVHSGATRAKLSKIAKAQMTPDARAAISRANKGRKLTHAQVEALTARSRGRPQSAETRAKRSASMRGNTNGSGHVVSEEHRTKLRGNTHALGLRHTPQWRAAAVARATGRVFSPEHRANIAAAARLRGISPETRAKINATKAAKSALAETSP